MIFPVLKSVDDLCEAVDTFGFVPFFRNSIPGFSVAEACPPELWFVDGIDGPWEWKGPVIRRTGCAYGKFFRGKAAYISKKWFPEFANYRRDGYDYDARVDDGLARARDARIMQALFDNPSLLSGELKAISCPGESSRKQFDQNVNYLQMQTYIITADFEYAQSKDGKPYGWGLARYATPDIWFGSAFCDRVYLHTPQASLRLILDHLRRLLPDASEKEIMYLVGRRD